MLVLTRGEGQSVLIGDDIRVTIVGTRSRQVRIAIDAPREVRVLRERLPVTMRMGFVPPPEPNAVSERLLVPAWPVAGMARAKRDASEVG